MQPTKETLRAIVALLPAIEGAAPGSLATYSGGAGLNLGEPLARLVELAYQGVILDDIDWPRWQDDARAILGNPAALAQVDMLTLRKLLTTLVRADRFASGTLADAARDGSLPGVLRRLDALTKIMPD